MKHMKVKCSILTALTGCKAKPIYLKHDLCQFNYGTIGFSIIPSMIDKENKRYIELFNKFSDSQCKYFLSEYNKDELSKWKNLISIKFNRNVNVIMFDEYLQDGKFMYDTYIDKKKVGATEGYPPIYVNNPVDGFRFMVEDTFYITPKDSFFENIYGKTWRHDKCNIKPESERHFLYNNELLELQVNIDGSLPNHLYLKDNQILYFHI